MKKIIYLILVTLLVLLLISCSTHYMSISKPDENDNTIIVGYQTIWLLYSQIHIQKAWLVNTKTRTKEEIDVIFKEKEDSNQ